MMSKSIKMGIGLAALLTFMAVQPVLADEATSAFIANVQRAMTTLDQMQALFVRMDQRKQSQAAGAAQPGAATTTPAQNDTSR